MFTGSNPKRRRSRSEKAKVKVTTFDSASSGAHGKNSNMAHGSAQKNLSRIVCLVGGHFFLLGQTVLASNHLGKTRFLCMPTLRNGFRCSFGAASIAKQSRLFKVTWVRHAWDGQSFYKQSVLALLLHAVDVTCAQRLVQNPPWRRYGLQDNKGNVFEDFSKTRDATSYLGR